MKIGTKGRLATTTLFATVLGLSLTMLWANSEVDAADHQRRRTSEIARALNDLRLVTFEYILYRTERARAQERAVASRLDDLLSAHPFDDPEAKEILADLRERNAVTQNIFRELVASPSGGSGVRVSAQSGTVLERFEAQLSRKLLVLQQESLVDAFRLGDYSTARISAAQRRVVGAIMTRQVRVAGMQRYLSELIPLFGSTGHHHIPIVDADDRLVGIVTQSDVVAALARLTTPDPA